MDLATLALAKNMAIGELSEIGQIGHIEVKEGYISAGDTPSNRFHINGELLGLGGGTLCHYSDIVLSKEDVKLVNVCQKLISTNKVFESLDYTNESIEYIEDGYIRMWCVSHIPYVVCVPLDAPIDETLTVRKGIYIFIHELDNLRMWAAHVKYETKTIHPIDPKYMPGVLLPVLDISNAIIRVFLQMENGGDLSTDLTDEEMAIVNKVISLKLPVIMTMAVGESCESYVASVANNIITATADGMRYVVNAGSENFEVILNE